MATHKHSKKRDAILECVRSTATHPTAEWVYAQLKPQIPDLSLGTVYRNLALLASLGEIQKITCEDGADRFDPNTLPHSDPLCLCIHTQKNRVNPCNPCLKNKWMCLTHPLIIK